MQEGVVLRNNYRLDRLIGRGGMADVYLAFDMRRHTHVALKVLREDLGEDPDFVRRFAREAEALAKLDHPNIVRFYSFERQGATAFIVMDYVPGSSLQRHIAEHEGPVPLNEIGDILHQVGAALHYAHHQGYVHRDIKPGNIMLRENGEVLLSDFGIARAAESATAATLTVGTPAYMSPEQILGRELDQRSDIYSLGVVLYEMAAGRRPFTGDERGITGTSTLARLREAHLKLSPPDPRTVNPALPAGLAEVIMRALAKDPAERYQDAVSLV
jgi:eukaryotic-like serine/threonine-protein kinase